MYLQMGIVLACIGCVVLYMLFQRWRVRKAVERARRESEEMQRSPRPFTAAELQAYDGRALSKPLLLALKGRVLDVTSGSEYYGPEGPYKLMAGRDASYAFAMMSLKAEDAHADLAGVPDEHLKILDDWYDKLTAKYPTVGRVQGPPGGREVEQVAEGGAPAPT